MFSAFSVVVRIPYLWLADKKLYLRASLYKNVNCIRIDFETEKTFRWFQTVKYQTKQAKNKMNACQLSFHVLEVGWQHLRFETRFSRINKVSPVTNSLNVVCQIPLSFCFPYLDNTVLYQTRCHLLGRPSRWTRWLEGSLGRSIKDICHQTHCTRNGLRSQTLCCEEGARDWHTWPLGKDI